MTTTVRIPVDELLSLIKGLDKRGRPRYNERVRFIVTHLNPITPVPCNKPSLVPEPEFSFWSDGYEWYLEVQDNA